MSMAPTTEPQPTSSDLGQRFFVLGIFAILVVEAGTTIINIGQHAEWTSSALGVLFCFVILYLGNWLYRGDKTALMWTRIWVVLQIAVVAMGVTHFSEEPDLAVLVRHHGVIAVWQGVLKLAV